MIHSISPVTNGSRRCLSPLPIAAKKSFTTWTFFSVLIEISPFALHRVCSDPIERFGTILVRPNRAVADQLLLLLEQILEDELTPGAAARVHQRATLVELSQLDGCEPELFGQGRHGSGRVLVVARQKDDPVAALDDRIRSEEHTSE